MLLKTHKSIKRIFTFLLAMLIIFSLNTVSCFAITAEEKAELQEEKDKIQAEIDANNEKIEKLEAQAAEYDDDVSALQDKIQVLQDQIDLYNDEIATIDSDINKIEVQIDDINSEIKKLEKKVENLNKQIAELEKEQERIIELLGKRIRASYMSGPNTSLEYLLTADEFEFQSYLERAEFLQRVAEQDDQNVKDLESAIIAHDDAITELEDVKVRHESKIEELDEVKAEYESKKEKKVAAKAEVVKAQDEYDADLAKVKEIVSGFTNKSDKLKEANDKRDKAMMELDEKMAEKNLYYGSGVVDGDMIWPLPGEDVYISSSFKWRWGRMHNGVDTCRWSGTEGADVIAVKDGTIEYAGWNGGYGNLIIVNHGEGVLTYYAHLSGYNCSVGQKVKQGYVIGYAGNTGYSFGAHLHFGVMINGTWVDPVLHVTRYTAGGKYIQHTDADGH